MPRQASNARTRLVHAALKLFATRGYDNTSIADVLTESGCTRGVLYYYFSSKEELGYAAMDEELRLIADQGAFALLRAEGDLIERLITMFERMPSTLTLETGDSFVTGLAPRMAATHEEFRQHLLAAQRTAMEGFQELVRKAVADGELADSVDPGRLAHFGMVVGYGLQMARLLGQEQLVPEDARGWIRDYLNSLRA